MFHLVSQWSGLFTAPSDLLLLLALAGFAASRLRVTARVGRRLMIGASVMLVGLAVFPVGDLMLSALERRFPVFRPDGRPADGIVVLGGITGAADGPVLQRVQMGPAVDRLVETARLAQDFPGAMVLVSAGPKDPRTGRSEAQILGRQLIAMGVRPDRLRLEEASRDTFENARFSVALARPSPTQRWLLVTSAWHMPRAVGCFRAAGFAVVAAPADRRSSLGGGGGWSVSENLSKVDLAAKEYLGLLVYHLRGRTSALFPGP